MLSSAEPVNTVIIEGLGVTLHVLSVNAQCMADLTYPGQPVVDQIAQDIAVKGVKK